MAYQLLVISDAYAIPVWDFERSRGFARKATKPIVRIGKRGMRGDAREPAAAFRMHLRVAGMPIEGRPRKRDPYTTSHLPLASS